MMPHMLYAFREAALAAVRSGSAAMANGNGVGFVVFFYAADERNDRKPGLLCQLTKYLNATYHGRMERITAREFSMNRVLAVIMGGGAGSRLFPLTKERAKPAVPIGGKYRLVDVPISNCINSEIRQIYVLTQFNSASLHRHIHSSYMFDRFSRGFVEILAAQQTI